MLVLNTECIGSTLQTVQTETSIFSETVHRLKFT